ncbi:hypothetical protein ACFXTH_040980 [Malus domestica]
MGKSIIVHQKFDLPALFVMHIDCPHYWRDHLSGETEEFSTRLPTIGEILSQRGTRDNYELILAYGRLGNVYGCDKYNIKPNLVFVAKALSSAYMPIGIVLVSLEVLDVIHS